MRSRGDGDDLDGLEIYLSMQPHRKACCFHLPCAGPEHSVQGIILSRRPHRRQTAPDPRVCPADCRHICSKRTQTGRRNLPSNNIIPQLPEDVELLLLQLQSSGSPQTRPPFTRAPMVALPCIGYATGRVFLSSSYSMTPSSQDIWTQEAT